MLFIQKVVSAIKSIISTKRWRWLGLLFVVYIIPLSILVQLIDEVRENDTLPFDETILHAINQTTNPFLDTFAEISTQIGGPVGAIAITAIVAGFLVYSRQRRNALVVVLGVGGAALINIILKALFQRDRPQLWERLVTENSYSFPSGHAMASIALALCLVVIFWPTRYRIPVLISGILFMFMIAWTRMYLGVHYPTDILAGWIVSVVWVFAVYHVIYRIKPTRSH